MNEFEEVFDAVRKQLHDTQTEATPIFNKVATHLTPLVKTSETVGGLKALIKLHSKLNELIRHYNARITAEQIIQAIDETREEIVRNK